MKIKEILIKFFEEKNVYPPLTIKKIKKAGYNVSKFLLELKDELEEAEDIKTNKSKKLEAFFRSCKKLI